MPTLKQPAPNATFRLDNPRGLAIADDELIYVADSGDPATSYSGRIIRIDAMGEVSSLSARFGAFAADLFGERYIFGLSDIAVTPDGLKVLMGLGAWLEEPVYAENRLIKLASDGSVTDLFDLTSVEMKHDPDGNGVEVNAAGVAVGVDGAVWVSDAAGNWVVQLVSSAGAEALNVETITAFPAVDGEDAVPTGIAVGPDSRAYVTLFRCQQPTSGKGGVARVMPDGSYEIVVSDLSNPIDVAFDASGRLYVLEFAVDYAPNSGRLLAVQANGQIETLLDGLTYPTSLAINEEGDVYVTEIASPGGGPAGSGRLLIFESLVIQSPR